MEDMDQVQVEDKINDFKFDEFKAEIYSDSDSDNNNEEFFFESDHIALRGNSDFSSTLRTLAVLEAQRIQATKDLDKLCTLEQTALDDPMAFFEKIKNGEEFIPRPISIAEVPIIDFEKYNIETNSTKNSNKEDGTNPPNRIKKIHDDSDIFNQNRNETHNQPWTTEEQRRLEELLVIYPPEQYEMRRFAKISNALGNRTTKQVASRVQKFFKKLHSAGMPIPGRIPKSQRAYKFGKFSFRPSTFFPAHNVPVIMREDDEDIDTSQSFNKFDSKVNQKEYKEETLNSETEENDSPVLEENLDKDFKILKLLGRVNKDKENHGKNQMQSVHKAFSCNECFEEPILGTRWHCITCTSESIDYCSDCFITQILSNTAHVIDHRFRDIRTDDFKFDSENVEMENIESTGVCHSIPNQELETNYDADYMLSKFSEKNNYNYLDPNFLP